MPADLRSGATVLLLSAGCPVVAACQITAAGVTLTVHVLQVTKPAGQDYQLLWRDEPDFVRMAAKTNALVIPFAVVGAEEAYDIFMDAGQVSLPVLVQQLPAP